jgi:18S rRNA (guanine1575-N7)-methyltransferase
MGRHDRPEHAAPPEIFYNDTEARKYTENSRIIKIQQQLTERALELLALPDDGTPHLLLDLGCGSGLSGEALTESGHIWIGTDISPSMLEVAQYREVEGDVALHDLGHGLPFRPGSFDGAISISAVQWLCNADKTINEPRIRLKRFFQTLYACLSKGSRAVLQIYPENTEQASMLVGAAMKVGFTGGLVVDFPHSTRAKKYFLVLMVGGGGASLPNAKGMNGEGEPNDDDEEDVDTQVRVMDRRSKKRRKGAGGGGGQGNKVKSRDWILKKKDQQRHKGLYSVKPDSKYTGRKRKDRF